LSSLSKEDRSGSDRSKPYTAQAAAPQKVNGLISTIYRLQRNPSGYDIQLAGWSIQFPVWATDCADATEKVTPPYNADVEDDRRLSERFQTALDLWATGVALRRQALRRSHPEATDETIEHLLIEWLHDRPGATHGDGPSRRLA
jgi:hypothetical protein